MCQLFGISSQQQISPNLLLAEFFQRGGRTAEHRDGWGIASFDVNKQLRIDKSIVPASECVKAQHYTTTTNPTQTLLAHIRKATYGQIHINNTHPFTANLWQEDWVFCHNGDLHHFDVKTNGDFLTKGQTDSERAFHLLLSRVAKRHHLPPSILELSQSLKEISDEIAQFGTFNYLLATSQFLYVYASTELYWTERNLPQTRIALVDSDRDISSDAAHDNQVIIIATQPLTKGEVWYPMGRGELRVFSKGKLILEQFDPSQTSAANDGQQGSYWRLI